MSEPEASTSLADLKGKTVYLSGPMSGYPDHNFHAFHEARKCLQAEGLTVVCPAEAGLVDGWEWEDYMRRDIVMLMDCDAMVMLPGWEDSRGARLESTIAWQLNMEVALYENLFCTYL